MKGYRFDPALLARREADPTFDPYRAAGQILRDHLGGGDIVDEVRERARRDPRLRAMIAHASALIAGAADVPRGVRGPRPRDRRGRRA